ncbi:hypothetical protein [Neochlamydia sp. AcF65]|uniref:hypothetical protein n=1 Tax=Neochlamydia sp. AcF65 TaxID=2795735 RepID=UPI001BCA3FD8|nr:hypothetical protein [Neochlamydia sp. AcF65]
MKERCFLQAGKLIRPFSLSSKVRCRGYSLPLERAITDFGADIAFGKVGEKMKEHYGIEAPSSMVRLITQKHASKIAKLKKETSSQEAIIISETDGSMVPIVEIDEADKQAKKDARKARKVCWKEAKLSLARGKDRANRFYAGSIGTAEQAGQQMLECASLAGLKEGSYVHAISDGAPWIAEQVKLKFCNRSGHLIDFYHLCEYLSEAAIWCNIFEPKKWLEESKEKLKAGKSREVFKEIENKFKALDHPEQENGLVKCYRYMEKRLDMMNYKSALDKGLPIGSGEIESSHRHVVQKRLKIAGAWWKTENANAMLNLRIGRLNGYWEAYWNSYKAAA